MSYFICYDELEGEFYFVKEQNRVNMSIPDVDIFVKIDIDNNKFIIQYYCLLRFMKYVFQCKDQDKVYEYMLISNVFKRNLFYDEDTNVFVVNELPEKIIQNKLYIQIEFIPQYQYKMYYNHLTCVNALSNQDIEFTGYMDKFVYIYTSTMIQFPILRKTFMKVMIYGYQNQHNKIKELLNCDLYFQNEIKKYNDKNIELLYNDLVYHSKEIYFQ
jgi:hypothetical protein